MTNTTNTPTETTTTNNTPIYLKDGLDSWFQLAGNYVFNRTEYNDKIDFNNTGRPNSFSGLEKQVLTKMEEGMVMTGQGDRYEDGDKFYKNAVLKIRKKNGTVPNEIMQALLFRNQTTQTWLKPEETFKKYFGVRDLEEKTELPLLKPYATRLRELEAQGVTVLPEDIAQDAYNAGCSAYTMNTPILLQQGLKHTDIETQMDNSTFCAKVLVRDHELHRRGDEAEITTLRELLTEEKRLDDAYRQATEDYYNPSPIPQELEDVRERIFEMVMR